MYSYWLKSDYDRCHSRWPSIENCPINSPVTGIPVTGELIGQFLIEGSPLARTGLLGKARKVCVCVCVCVSALSQLSVMMHCMLETFLCHVFRLAQVQDRMPPKSVAFNQELPEQYACYRKAHQVARWHLYIIPSLVSMCAQALYLLGLVNKSKADSVLTPGSGCPSID